MIPDMLAKAYAAKPKKPDLPVTDPGPRKPSEQGEPMIPDMTDRHSEDARDDQPCRDHGEGRNVEHQETT